MSTVDPRTPLSGTLIIRHHFRVNVLIDFAVLLINYYSSHAYFDLQLHFFGPLSSYLACCYCLLVGEGVEMAIKYRNFHFAYQDYFTYPAWPGFLAKSVQIIDNRGSTVATHRNSAQDR